MNSPQEGMHGVKEGGLVSMMSSYIYSKGVHSSTFLCHCMAAGKGITTQAFLPGVVSKRGVGNRCNLLDPNLFSSPLSLLGPHGK